MLKKYYTLYMNKFPNLIFNFELKCDDTTKKTLFNIYNSVRIEKLIFTSDFAPTSPDTIATMATIAQNRATVFILSTTTTTALREKLKYTFVFIGNSIFHLSLELLTKFWKTSLKVA